MRAPASARAAALATAAIEDLAADADAATMVAGGRQTKGALPIADIDAAVYSSRGRGYARYNEDAAGLFRDRKGRAYAFVLDQAGGLGGQVRGRASALAGKRLFDACRSFAQWDDGNAEASPSSLLLKAFERAHNDLLDRGEGEVTTAVVVVSDQDHAHLVNSGDSGAMHFDGKGQLKAMTDMQEFEPPNEGCLQHALGLEPEGHEPGVYEWTLEPGDWVLLATDGLLDAGISEEALGRMLAGAESAEVAVNQICATALRRMGTLRAKPDNLTVVALRTRLR